MAVIEPQPDEPAVASDTSPAPENLTATTVEQEETASGSGDEETFVDALTHEQLLERAMEQANDAKMGGNKQFGLGCYEDALSNYELALRITSELPGCDELRSACYANRAICFLKLRKYEDTIKECSKALELNPSYVKALVRRAEAHEKLDHFEEAITDMKKVVELEPSDDQARKTIRRLEPLAEEKREKMKEEMIAMTVNHRPEKRSQDDDPEMLRALSHSQKFGKWHINDDRVKQKLSDAGFLEVTKLDWKQLDLPLITALVERWNPKNNTFTFPHGEMTITLKDVALILGLPVDGEAITADFLIGEAEGQWPSWHEMCNIMLGVVPENLNDSERCLKLKWIHENFALMNLEEADELQVTRYTRAYILEFIGAVLLPDSSGNKVHLRYLPFLFNFHRCATYAWGAAVLAFLYRELTNATKTKKAKIAGCLHLLQIWSFEHFSVGRAFPSGDYVHYDGPYGTRWNKFIEHRELRRSHKSYRAEFDSQEPMQIKWDPYPRENLNVPNICIADMHIWLARVPIICFHIVEMYRPDRVLRQFGYPQVQPYDIEETKRVDGRGRADTAWLTFHKEHVDKWNDKLRYILHPEHAPEDALVEEYETHRAREYLSQPPRSTTEFHPVVYKIHKLRDSIFKYAHDLVKASPRDIATIALDGVDSLIWDMQTLNIDIGGYTHPDTARQRERLARAFAVVRINEPVNVHPDPQQGLQQGPQHGHNRFKAPTHKRLKEGPDRDKGREDGRKDEVSSSHEPAQKKQKEVKGHGELYIREVWNEPGQLQSC